MDMYPISSKQDKMVLSQLKNPNGKDSGISSGSERVAILVRKEADGFNKSALNMNSIVNQKTVSLSLILKNTELL